MFFKIQIIITETMFVICNYLKTAGNYVYAAPLVRRKAILPPVYEQCS